VSAEPYRVLDLFSGIGGFSLGLEAAGFRTVAFCEVNPTCRFLLAHHWPDVPCYDDVQTLTADRLAADGIAVDVICGGFPCQDISYAGKGAGLAGERSGLWREYARLIGELRPRYVVVENVSALLSRGLGVVLGDLAELGYDAVWDRVRAFDIGAPHLRARLWIVAYPRGEQHEGFGYAFRRALSAGLLEAFVANAGHGGFGTDDGSAENPGPSREDQGEGDKRKRVRAIAGRGRTDMADADNVRKLQPQGSERDKRRRTGDGRKERALADTLGDGREQVVEPISRREKGEGPANQAQHAGVSRRWLGWATEPDVGRVAHGVPARVDRLHGLGNAVVPEIPRILGRAILEARRVAA
jgi:DNA (cytosine-5)-methyltransferase 1